MTEPIVSSRTTQQRDVWLLMRDGHWRTLAEISAATGHPEASVSARLRQFRPDRIVYGERMQCGLWRYQVGGLAR